MTGKKPHLPVDRTNRLLNGVPAIAAQIDVQTAVVNLAEESGLDALLHAVVGVDLDRNAQVAHVYERIGHC
jgi:hypothetical protein